MVEVIGEHYPPERFVSRHVNAQCLREWANKYNRDGKAHTLGDMVSACIAMESVVCRIDEYPPTVAEDVQNLNSAIMASSRA